LTPKDLRDVAQIWGGYCAFAECQRSTQLGALDERTDAADCAQYRIAAKSAAEGAMNVELNPSGSTDLHSRFGLAFPDVHPDLPAGIIIGGALVRQKIFESSVLFGIFVTGSIGGAIWALTQGLTWIELSLFAIMYSVTAVGIGVSVHRMLVHRSSMIR
jgi:hypothetical protein